MARRAIEVSDYDKFFNRFKVCQQCGAEFLDRRIRGRIPKYCSDACKQKAYRQSKRV